MAPLNMMRNKTFDVLRGLAISLMVLANAAPLYKGEFPFAMRILFSLPAPMFIMISGLMLSLGERKHSFSYFLKRGLFIFIVAVCVDVCIHQINPFQSFDVLYLIGFSMPFVILALRLPIYAQYGVIFGIVALAELVRYYFGYAPLSEDESFDFCTLAKQFSNYDVKNWLFNGDFPILPWTGVMLFGGLIGKLYVASKNEKFFQGKNFLGHIIAMIVLGTVLITTLPKPIMYVSNGYVELFYQANAGLLIYLLLFPMVLLFLSAYIPKYSLFANLGRSSLVIYVLHLFLIHYVFGAILETVASLQVYFLLYVVHFILIYSFSCLLIKLKAKYHHNMPTVITWMIGT